jgi:hypothetical protein
MSLAQILGLTGQTKIPKRFAPFYQQAGSEALVRYAPEWDNLSQLRAASAQTMRQRVAQARTAGAILNNAASMAIKDVQANPNASSPALQSLLPMLTQRQQDAPIVANQQALQATNEHLQDLDKIHAQRASLLGQIGTFTIGRATDLVGRIASCAMTSTRRSATLNSRRISRTSGIRRRGGARTCRTRIVRRRSNSASRRPPRRLSRRRPQTPSRASTACLSVAPASMAPSATASRIASRMPRRSRRAASHVTTPPLPSSRESPTSVSPSSTRRPSSLSSTLPPASRRRRSSRA